LSPKNNPIRMIARTMSIFVPKGPVFSNKTS
jgi:hypothetical protein